MKNEKNEMVKVYDGGGAVPHCKYTGRIGDLTAYEWTGRAHGLLADALTSHAVQRWLEHWLVAE